jgi:hypothetical protein
MIKKTVTSIHMGTDSEGITHYRSKVEYRIFGILLYQNDIYPPAYLGGKRYHWHHPI